MVSIFRSSLFRAIVSCMFAATLLLAGCYGILILAESRNRHGSSGGSALLFIFGLFLLISCIATLIIWFFHWKTPGPTSAEKNN
jgi:uncharacterized membrane protein HdeD (DUF308 family)